MNGEVESEMDTKRAEFEKAQQWAEVIKKIIRIMSSYKY